MKKINFRPIFYCCLMFVLALVLSRQIFCLSIVHIIFALTVIFTILAVCIKFKCLKRFIALLCAFTVGLGYYFVGLWTFNQQSYESDVVVSARVKSVYEGSGYNSYILDDVKINLSAKNCCISMTVYGDEILPRGSRVSFEGKVKNVDLFFDGKLNSYYYSNNIAYKCYINFDDISVGKGYTKLNEDIIKSFNDYLKKYMDDDISGLVTCVLFGDKTELNPNINTAYDASGMSHLLAVSGMHIMLLVNIFTILLSKIKIKRWIKFVILAVVLTFFTYLCDFAPSIVRALIMGLIFSFSTVVGKKYDRLNSMALCAFIMLAIRPFDVFDAGFVLSFMCVFCIFTLQKPIKRCLQKIGCNEKIADALAVLFGVQIGLLPVLTIYSQTFNIFSLAINFVCVPLFESVFVITLAVVPICIILPFVSFVLEYLGFIYFAVTSLAGFVGSLMWANLPLAICNDILIFCIYAVVFMLSDYVNLKRHKKVAYALFVLAIGFGATFALI